MPEKPPAADARTNIESVLHEDRKFECPVHFRQQAHIKSLEDYERIYRESVEQPEKFWSGIAERAALVQDVGQGPRMESALGEMVCRRPAQHFLQLSRPPCADRPQEQGRFDLGERTRRSPHSYLPATSSRSTEVRQRPEIAWRQKGRPGRHLHGHDSRVAHCHAGLRPHRRPAHGSLRRIFLKRSRRSHS